MNGFGKGLERITFQRIWGVAKKFLVPFFALLILCGLGELFLRMGNNLGFNDPNAIDSKRNRGLPEVYEGAPWEPIEFSIPIVRNIQRVRYPVDLTHIDKNDRVWLVFGDSFVEAKQVEIDHTFPLIVQKETDLAVIPIQIGNVSIEDRVKKATSTIAKYRESFGLNIERIVLTIRHRWLRNDDTPTSSFVINSFHNMLDKYYPKKLETEIVKGSSSFFSLLTTRFSTFFSNARTRGSLPPLDRDISAQRFGESAQLINDLSGQSGIPVVVMILQTHGDVSSPETKKKYLDDSEKFAHQLGVLGIPTIVTHSLDRYDFFSIDAHPNESGHSKYAQALLEWAKKTDLTE